MDSFLKNMLQRTDTQVNKLTQFQTDLLNVDEGKDTQVEKREADRNSVAQQMTFSVSNKNDNFVNPDNISETINSKMITSLAPRIPPSSVLNDTPVEDLISDAEKDLPESTKLGISQYTPNNSPSMMSQNIAPS